MGQRKKLTLTFCLFFKLQITVQMKRKSRCIKWWHVVARSQFSVDSSFTIFTMLNDWERQNHITYKTLPVLFYNLSSCDVWSCWKLRTTVSWMYITTWTYGTSTSEVKSCFFLSWLTLFSKKHIFSGKVEKSLTCFSIFVSTLCFFLSGSFMWANKTW